MSKFFLLWVVSFLLFFTTSIQASIVLNGTRVIYKGNMKDTSLTIKNSDDQPLLVQSWVETTANKKDNSPFIITPPLFKIEGDQESTLRIIKLPNALPQDRESLFWLNVKGIPSSEQDSKNKLIIAIKTQIKLIYRPDALLDGSPIEASQKLQWKRNGNNIKVTNNSPYYINFNYIKINSAQLEDREIRYLPPYSSKEITVKAPTSGVVLRWQSINDYGGIEKENTVNL